LNPGTAHIPGCGEYHVWRIVYYAKG